MVKKLGFSLIELVVVIGLLSLLMLAISGTMLMTIVSSNRVRTATKTKQAGNYALGQIQGMVRNARSLDCVAEPTAITILGYDGGETLFTTSLSRIASNSAYLTPASTTVSNLTFTCLPNPGPTLVKVIFDLQDSSTTLRSTGNPLLHFETSINLRNQ